MGPLGLRGCSTCIINGIYWAYFTFGGNIPYSSLCIVYFSSPHFFFSLYLSPVTFFLDVLRRELYFPLMGSVPGGV